MSVALALLLLAAFALGGSVSLLVAAVFAGARSDRITPDTIEELHDVALEPFGLPLSEHRMAEPPRSGWPYVGAPGGAPPPPRPPLR